MRLFRTLVFIALLTTAAFAAQPLLPASFAGWQKAPGAKAIADPAAIDPANPNVLKEYGFTGGEVSQYTRDGRKLTIRAARFNDASGAFGAFTFYRNPDMELEKAGDGAASTGNRVLFFKGNILVDANFEKTSAMSLSEMRSLADALPPAPKDASTLPTLPGYLPQQNLVKGSARYIMGPSVMGTSDSPGLADFSKGAEVEAANYTTSLGTASLFVISYPTNQIATEELRTAQAAAPDATIRRTGPMLVVARGPISQGEARALTESVNYDASVTWNERTKFDKFDNIGVLVISVAMLVVVLVAVALFGGFMVGGLRVLMRRGKPEAETSDFIKLDLKS
jgi:uncharacterized protein DUF6599